MDKYNVTARLYPMILFYFPAFLMLLIIGWDFTKYAQYGTSLGIVGMLSYLLANIGRDGGKVKQEELWESWGGAPTTTLFRWSDSKIDRHSKQRYHAKLAQLCPVQHLPTEQFEHMHPEEADEVYKHWTKYMISKTRDVKVYPLIFRENISYGFRRNLWGLKPFAITLIGLLAISAYLYFSIVGDDWRIACMPKIFFAIESLFIALTMFWVFIITKEWVSIPAFAYAERVHEAIEVI